MYNIGESLGGLGLYIYAGVVYIDGLMGGAGAGIVYSCVQKWEVV